MSDPRIRVVPAYEVSRGPEVVELYQQATGDRLDKWQANAIVDGCGVRGDGKWAAFEAAANGPRQNGKNEIAIARQLGGLFLFKSRLLIHSAHEFKTSTEHQRRLEEIIQNNPDLHKRVKPRGYKHSHGEESIELRTGQRIRFMTRTKSGGKGHTGDEVYFDEAQILAAPMHGALMPTLSARSVLGNPQLWYFMTAVDQLLHEHGLVAAKLRRRALDGSDPRLAYLEWSAGLLDAEGREMLPSDVTLAQASDERWWAQANPALDVRIAREHVLSELRSMDLRTFVVERLGMGDYPDVSGEAEMVIPLEAWNDAADVDSLAVGGRCLAFDVRPDRSWSAVAAAGVREDGLAHLEVIAHERGTGWVVKWLAEFVEAEKPLSVVCDGGSPAASLLVDLERAGVKVETLSATEYAQACGQLFDLVDQKAGRHRGQQELDAAVRGAAKRPLGEAWAWSRKGSADITPLVAVTLAWFGYASRESAPPPPMIAFA